MATLAQNAPVEQTALITVPFHGNNLFIVNHNNEPYTPMKPIVEGMGLDWAAQFTKLKQRFASTIVEIAMVANDGKERLMTCLPLRKLFGWLNSISPNKVNPEIRDTVIMYQNECDDALYAYWTKGVAINPHATQQALPTPPTNLHLALTKTIKAIGKGSRQNYSTLYTRVYDKFQVNSYKELTVEQCQAAIEFVKSVEGEFIGRDKIAAPKDKINDGEHYFVVKDGVVLWEKTLKSHCDDIPENVLQNPALMLEHIRQVVGEFVGKGALPAPKPTLDIHFPISWIVENNKPVLKAANTLFNKVSFSLYDLTHPDVRLPTKAILNTLKIAGYCVDAAEAEMYALYNQLSKCRDAIISIEALTNAGMRQYSSTWPVIPA